MTAAPNAAVSSALPLAIPLPSTASILNAIDPSLPPPSPIQQPRTVRLLTHQLMKTIAALTDFSPKIRGSFQLHHHHRPPLSLQQPSTLLPSSSTLYLSLWDDNIRTHELKLFNWRYPTSDFINELRDQRPSIIFPSTTILRWIRWTVDSKSLAPLTILRLLVPLHRLGSDHSTIDEATVIEWLHYPLGYPDGKDQSKIIISKRRWFSNLLIQNGIWI